MRMHLEKKRMLNPVCKICTAPDTSAKPEDELDSCAKAALPRLIEQSPPDVRPNERETVMQFAAR
jgi:hypothetical protein